MTSQKMTKIDSTTATLRKPTVSSFFTVYQTTNFLLKNQIKVSYLSSNRLKLVTKNFRKKFL